MKPVIQYYGEVPIEATTAGSQLLYRLLKDSTDFSYQIVEITSQRSVPENRLENAIYEHRKPALSRLRKSRFIKYAFLGSLIHDLKDPLWISHSRSNSRASPEAIITVLHGTAWVKAARIASYLGVPLHTIVHDAPAYTAPVPSFASSLLRHRLNTAYLQSYSRFCVSPYMERWFQSETGVEGQVLYPSRSAATTTYTSPPQRLKFNSDPFTLAYAGSLNTGDYLRTLRAVALELLPIRGRLIVYSSIDEGSIAHDTLSLTNVEIRNFIPSNELINRLRLEADCLLLPMSFSQSDRFPMSINFPSKLVDYTTAGIPILILGPDDSSGFKWGTSNPTACYLLNNRNPAEIRSALEAIRNSPFERFERATRCLSLGATMFDANKARNQFQSRIHESITL